MAHAFIMDFDGGTVEQYDAIMADMQLGGVLPPGALFHAAGATPTGLMVCDVWETAEAFDAFAQAKIGPLSAKHGIAGPPRLRTFDVAQTRENGPGDVGLMQIVTLDGVDAATFAQLDTAVLGPERAAPDGCVYHVNGPLGGDWIVLDYWTTAEIHDAFIADRVAPAMQAAGRTEPPAIEAIAVHNALTQVAATR